MFLEFFNNMSRLGPGSDQISNQVINKIQKNKIKNILICGCGRGDSIEVLLNQFQDANIYAIDLDENLVKNAADKFKNNNNVVIKQMNMSKLEFNLNYFDLIWAESSIYNIGFENGINYFNDFLTINGYIAVSELTYNDNINLPHELVEFWKQNYPTMISNSKNVKIIENNFKLIDSFDYSNLEWYDNYYYHLENNISKLSQKYKDNEEFKEIKDILETEIMMYKKYANSYNYRFYLLQK